METLFDGGLESPTELKILHGFLKTSPTKLEVQLLTKYTYEFMVFWVHFYFTLIKSDPNQPEIIEDQQMMTLIKTSFRYFIPKDPKFTHISTKVVFE